MTHEAVGGDAAHPRRVPGGTATIARRDFLRLGAAVAGGVAIGPTLLGAQLRTPGHLSVLDAPATECPIDTVVVLMMENRSFDHYLGYLADDQQYAEDGRGRWGKGFAIRGNVHQQFRRSDHTLATTEPLAKRSDDPNPFRGCTGPSPGHTWDQSRVQLADGFIADGSGNSEFALGYYVGDDLPVYDAMARRFTVCDHHFASVLGPTFPNRQYFHSAESEGQKVDPGPLRKGQFDAITIWDKLDQANATCGYYYTDTPGPLLAFGDRMAKYIQSLDGYFADCAAGVLPNFVFIDPSFGTALLRTDDHPRGDVRLGQRFALEVFGALTQSPQWPRSMFVLLYDEWGGFFDHVRPPRFHDERSSAVLANDFAQAGFRVPAFIASPYARRNFVDHHLYDHTSVMRFLQWRFLGARPHGPGVKRSSWHLTQRDRHARNYGWSLHPTKYDPEVDLKITLPGPSPSCSNEAVLEASDPEPDAFRLSDELSAEVARLYPAATATPWLTP